MSFLESYKRLDNLCKDMYSDAKGVTAYIEHMEHYSNAGFRIRDWNSDYQNLKHYRYVRNQIVHENYATEDNMCDESDVKWIDNFYKRIIKTTDPLAQYQQLLNSSKTTQQKQYRSYVQPKEHPVSQTNHHSHSWIIILISVLAVIAMIALVYFLLQTI